MRRLLFVAVACTCATAPGPKAPDESRRVPVNRTIPPEVRDAVNPNPASSAHAAPREGEVQWR